MFVFSTKCLCVQYCVQYVLKGAELQQGVIGREDNHKIVRWNIWIKYWLNQKNRGRDQVKCCKDVKRTVRGSWRAFVTWVTSKLEGEQHDGLSFFNELIHSILIDIIWFCLHRVILVWIRTTVVCFLIVESCCLR